MAPVFPAYGTIRAGGYVFGGETGVRNGGMGITIPARRQDLRAGSFVCAGNAKTDPGILGMIDFRIPDEDLRI